MSLTMFLLLLLLSEPVSAVGGDVEEDVDEDVVEYGGCRVRAVPT